MLPRYDVPPYDRFSTHPEIEARRMSLLYAFLSAGPETPLTVVAPWSALLRRVPPRAEVRSRVTHLERGLSVDRDALVEVLVQAGYQRTSLVEERGEVGARGGIVDLFPPQLDRPVRIEFDFDAIGSLRRFDPTTQRSEGELDSVVAIPPRAYRLPNDIDALLNEVRRRGREQKLPESQIYTVTEAFTRQSLPPGVENLEALLHDGLETVFDYLPASTRVLVDDPDAGRTRALAYVGEIFSGHEHARAQDRLVCDPLSLYTTDDSAWHALLERKPVLFDPLGMPDPLVHEEVLDVRGADHRELRREIEEQRGSGHALEPLTQRLADWRTQGRRVRITCTSPSAADRLVDILSDYGLALRVARGHAFAELPQPGEIDVAVAPLADGFELPDDGLVVLTEQNVFGQRQQRRAVRVTRQTNAIERLAQIQEGDFLVHAEHGIGRFGGLVRISVLGGEQEFLLLLYEKGDKLYVPVSRLGQVQRYASAEDASPASRPARRHGLDAHEGARASRRRGHGRGIGRGGRRARDARRSRRSARPTLRTRSSKRAFAGTTRPTSARPPTTCCATCTSAARWTGWCAATSASARPKSRVAPRTCARWTDARSRSSSPPPYCVSSTPRRCASVLRGTAVEIANLSRLTSPKQLREVKDGLSSGTIDIVIGTHRLLSKDIGFRNLGLVIVDEEQWFGVAHKERLKQLRKLVDVLTLDGHADPAHVTDGDCRHPRSVDDHTPPPDRRRFARRSCAVRRQGRSARPCCANSAVAVRSSSCTIGRDHRSVSPSGCGAGSEARIVIAHGQMSAHQLRNRSC